MLDLPLATTVLAIVSGSLVGLVLGLVGGGGSILALPLLVYVVGFRGDPHVAIGTTALSVAASALANLIQHRRLGNVHWGVGLWFALPGVGGALAGAALGLATPGDKLLFLFALLMLIVAARLWRQQEATGPLADGSLRSPRTFHPGPVAVAGAIVGAFSGFFGIGGGFLIVPALLWTAGLDMRKAIGTSLLAISAFGVTTATRYSIAGHVDLPLSVLFVLGGIVGGIAGTLLCAKTHDRTLRVVFAAMLVPVSVYMLYRNYAAFIP